VKDLYKCETKKIDKLYIYPLILPMFTVIHSCDGDFIFESLFELFSLEGNCESSIRLLLVFRFEYNIK